MLAAVFRIVVVASDTIPGSAVVESCRLGGVDDDTADRMDAYPLASWVVDRLGGDDSSCTHLADCRVERMDLHGKIHTRSSRILGEHEEMGVESTWWRLIDSIRPSKSDKRSGGGDRLEDSVGVASWEERAPHGDARVDSSLVRMASSRGSTTDSALELDRYGEHDEEEGVYETIEWCDRRREAFSFFCCCWLEKVLLVGGVVQSSVVTSFCGIDANGDGGAWEGSVLQQNYTPMIRIYEQHTNSVGLSMESKQSTVLFGSVELSCNESVPSITARDRIV